MSEPVRGQVEAGSAARGSNERVARWAAGFLLFLCGGWVCWMMVRELIMWMQGRASLDVPAGVSLFYLAIVTWTAVWGAVSFWTKAHHSTIYWAWTFTLPIPGIAYLVRDLTNSSDWGGSLDAGVLQVVALLGVLILLCLTAAVALAPHVPGALRSIRRVHHHDGDKPSKKGVTA